MISGINTSGVSSATLYSKSANAVLISNPIAPEFSGDRISSTISEFSVTTPMEDFLPQGKHISSRKNFKTIKEYVAYMLLVYERMKQLEPKLGELTIKQEDKTEYLKLKHEISSLTETNVLL